MPIRTVSKELQDKAIADLNEDPKRIEDDFKHIREWAAKQPHLRIRTDDEWLLAFLRGSKYRLEVAKRKLETLSVMRAALPTYFAKRDPNAPKMQDLLKIGTCLPLTKTLGPSGPIIVLNRLGNADPSKFEISDAFQVTTMIQDILLMENDNTNISGCHMIADLAGVRMQDALRFTPDIIKTNMKLFKEGYPLRLQGIHVINAPAFTASILDSLKSTFLNKKLQNRVHFYGSNYDEVYKSIPLSMFPKEYGGDGDSLQQLIELWKNKVESYRDWFLEDAKYCLDEAKCPGKLHEHNESLGTKGSFRKLAVD